MVAEIAEQLRLPKKIVDNTYKSYWKVIREHITALPLKEDLTEEKFNKLQPNVNIPSIGKFNVTLDRYKGVKRKAERINRLKQENNVTYNKD